MAKELTELEKHYNKFNEEKRLGRRHGQVEYRITMEYIHRYLKEMEQPKILDVGAVSYTHLTLPTNSRV